MPSLQRKQLDLKFGCSRSKPSSFARDRSGASTATRLFVSFSTPEEEEGDINASGRSVTENIESSSSTRSTTSPSNYGGDYGFEIPTTFDSSLIPNVVATAIVLVVGTIGLQFLGSMGAAFAIELSREASTFVGNLVNIASAIVAAVFGILRVLVPFVGRGVVDGVTAAAPVVRDAATSAAGSQIVRDAADAVTASASPVFDTVGRALGDVIVDPIAQAAAPVLESVGRVVDDGIVSPVRQAVDAGIVEPMQQATDMVGRAVDESIVSPIQRAMPAMPVVEAPALPSLPRIPEMPDSSVTIGNMRIF